MKVSIKTVKFYSEYFGIEYPLKKLDLIAVPENPIEGLFY
jgi:aminopeptidase N